MVTSRRGSFEWDDDNLIPGNSKDGGLHNNLYDSDGKLKGSARFIPDDEPDPVVVNKPTNTHGKAHARRQVHQGRRVRVQGEVVEFLADIVKGAAKELVIEATPHVRRLWEEKALPVIEARRAEAVHDAKLLWDEKAMPIIERQVVRQREKLAARKTNKAAAKQPIVIEGEVVPNEERRDR
ncbi:MULTISPECIES: hypothetical protein [Rhodococcus]|uniref:hypothetical protein n=1 Tax=Rhodococcus TaxID=1827 RepID=UPI001E5F5447|nr:MULTISPECIES: hypothetical protein [Rhodococcus]UEL36277.1 hypothetical protein KTR60_12140 [Rhodococcus sp. C1]UXF69714.1 hypothetical protein N6G92_12005 [Rhodococcus qingshengii]